MDFQIEPNRIFLSNNSGETVAEVLFPDIADGVVSISRTFVDESMRGQGVASKLLRSAADKLRAEHKKVVPVCSYAVKWFETHPDDSDILAEDLTKASADEVKK